MGIKFTAKVLENRLAKIVTKILHKDQFGFIPSCSMAVNIGLLFLNIQLPKNNPGNRPILSLNASKAFDSIEWPYLCEVLGTTF